MTWSNIAVIQPLYSMFEPNSEEDFALLQSNTDPFLFEALSTQFSLLLTPTPPVTRTPVCFPRSVWSVGISLLAAWV